MCVCVCNITAKGCMTRKGTLGQEGKGAEGGFEDLKRDCRERVVCAVCGSQNGNVGMDGRARPAGCCVRA